MNKPIMDLSNHLVYDFEMVCGTEELKEKRLNISLDSSKKQTSKWLQDVTDPRYVFNCWKWLICCSKSILVVDYGEYFQEETLADGVYVNRKEAILVKRVWNQQLILWLLTIVGSQCVERIRPIRRRYRRNITIQSSSAAFATNTRRFCRNRLGGSISRAWQGMYYPVVCSIQWSHDGLLTLTLEIWLSS